MNVTYVTNARLPTDWAHGLQIMKTCAALAHAGAAVTLLSPARSGHIKGSPFEYYGIPETFSWRKLFTLDTGSLGRFGFILQSLTFALAATLALRGDAPLYCRDEIIAAALIALGKKNVIWESHDGAWNVWARYAAHQCAAMAVVSDGLKAFYAKKGIAAARISVIRNGIDLSAYAHPESKEAARARLGLPADKSIALYAGMFDGWKGMDTLLAAAKLLPERILLVVIGGEDAAQIQALAQKNPRVQFLGYRPARELPDNLAAADVLILPNTGKHVVGARFTSPLKLFAYMASGKPVVASDLPAIRELITDESAFLVAPDDPAALARGIESALADSDEAGRRAARARSAVERFTWDARAQLILALAGSLSSAPDARSRE